MSEQNERNRAVIEQFRTNGGKTAGQYATSTLLLLTTIGAKSGQKRTNPLAYLAEGDRLYIFASHGGSPTNPDWYHNLVKHPEVHVEVGTDAFDAIATVITGGERDRIYARQAALRPNFGEYQQKTQRTIPVVALTRRG